MVRELTITIEGDRRNGKTTLAMLLSAFLKRYNYDVVVQDHNLATGEAIEEGKKLLFAEKEFQTSYVTIKTSDK